MKNKIVVILFGPPGSGKGTQADRIAGAYGLAHINTGGLIEKTVHDPAYQNDFIIQRERNFFDSGMLCTPEWVVELIQKEIRKDGQIEQGIVFSASPRTLHEAEVLIPFFESIYGRESIFFLRIRVRPETSIFRNSHRRVCEQCGAPLLYTPENAKLDACSVCGGKLVVRTLDNPEAIKIRLTEYENRTKPIFEFLSGRGYKIIVVDGETDPDSVARNIEAELTKYLARGIANP